MLPSLARSAVNISAAPLKVLADQLLPSIPLYRRLLRVHRKVLPIEMRVMGDEYVKAEFRKTRSTDNPLYIVGFLGEWKKYLDFHEAQLANAAQDAGETLDKGKARAREGQKLQEEVFEKLSADQLGQLYELLQATKQAWTDPAASAEVDGVETAAPPVDGIPKGEVLPDLASKDPTKA